jgi:drug/metabolite transporter (DMT)-like permease
MLKTVLISIAMVIMGIIGDFFIKKASMFQSFTGWKLLVAGGLLYGLSAIGWFYVYRTTKVFTVGAIHSFGIIILSIILSLVIFKEKINSWEILGLLLGIISLSILLRNYVPPGAS